jgi:hypothetical protein
MGFWNKKTPEGETEEQIKQREEKEQNDFISALMGKFEEKIKPLNDKVSAWDDRWKKLEDAAAGSVNDDSSNDANLSDDEKQRMNEEVERRKLLAISIATNARITENEVLADVKEKFPELAEKVKEFLVNTPLERKGQQDYQQYCRNVVSMVVGQAAMTGGLQYNPATKQFFLENASAGSRGEQLEFLAPDMAWTDPSSGRTLTGRQQLEKLGIAPEDFAKSVKNGVV